MCIRDSADSALDRRIAFAEVRKAADYRGCRDGRRGLCRPCLLYTSDAADERSSVDLGGRRIIKKKKMHQLRSGGYNSK